MGMGRVNLMLGMLPDLGRPGLAGGVVESPEHRENILEREPERRLAASRLSIPSSQEVLDKWTNFKSTISSFIEFALQFLIEIKLKWSEE